MYGPAEGDHHDAERLTITPVRCDGVDVSANMASRAKLAAARRPCTRTKTLSPPRRVLPRSR